MAHGRLTAKFWVGFYEKFPSLKKGCLHGLPVPEEFEDVRENLQIALAHAHSECVANRSTDLFERALNLVSNDDPLNLTEFYGLVQGSAESPIVTAKAALKMQLALMNYLTRISPLYDYMLKLLIRSNKLTYPITFVDIHKKLTLGIFY